MARLTSTERKALPASDFALPGTRQYPIQNPSHARNALARAAQNATPAQQRQIRTAVKARYPGIGQNDGDAEDRADGGVDEATEKKRKRMPGQLAKAAAS